MVVSQQLLIYPGYNDSNRHRVDITDRVRREADAELIVTLPGRSEDDNMLRVLVRNSVHAHGADNTIIILTQCSVSVTLFLSPFMLITIPTGGGSKRGYGIRL